MNLYISSYDYPDFETPRRIIDFVKSQIEARKVLIVSIEVPLIGQKYGFGGSDIYELFLINRIDETAFDTLDKFPIDVHVLIRKREEINKSIKSFSQLYSIAWASLYDNLPAQY